MLAILDMLYFKAILAAVYTSQVCLTVNGVRDLGFWLLIEATWCFNGFSKHESAYLPG